MGRLHARTMSTPQGVHSRRLCNNPAPNILAHPPLQRLMTGRLITHEGFVDTFSCSARGLSRDVGLLPRDLRLLATRSANLAVSGLFTYVALGSHNVFARNLKLALQSFNFNRPNLRLRKQNLHPACRLSWPRREAAKMERNRCGRAMQTRCGPATSSRQNGTHKSSGRATPSRQNGTHTRRG